MPSVPRMNCGKNVKLKPMKMTTTANYKIFSRSEDVQNLELGRVGCVAPRHAQRAQDELREECQVEADENDHNRQLQNLLQIGRRSEPGTRAGRMRSAAACPACPG